MTITIDSKVEQFIGTPRQAFINGQFVDAVSGKTFETPNPATGETLAHVAEGDAEDIDRAVSAARAAFDGPVAPDDAVRARPDHLEDRRPAPRAHRGVRQLESLDNGKPLSVAQGADVPLAVDLFRYMAGWATKIEGNTIPISVPYMPGANFHAYTLREPIGVVGQIIPWNFPLLMAAWKLGPALATGCTIVLKPAEQTPLTALRLAEIIAEAGLPDGVVNVVPGFGETAGAALAAHPDVDKVAFTGSTEVGKLIVQAAAGNLKKVTLELGGKSPNIVFDDADATPPSPARPTRSSSTTASAAAPARGCSCRRAVRQGRRRRGRERQAIKLGPGMDESTQMGPLVSQEQLSRVCGYLDSGKKDGATALTGGSRHGESGYFVEPTVLANATPRDEDRAGGDLRAGRVAAPFESPDDVAAVANDTIYGLGAGVWTRTSPRPTRSPRRSGPARSGSTATTSSTPRCRSAATSSLAGAAKWATRYSRPTRR